jgi:hypothetical protein
MTTMTSHVPLDPSLSFLGQLPRLTVHEEATLLRQVERARLEQVHALLREIAERERAVITLRYGLDETAKDRRPLGYEEIGQLALNPGHACLEESPQGRTMTAGWKRHRCLR